VVIAAALPRDKPYPIDLAAHALPHAAALSLATWLLIAKLSKRGRGRRALEGAGWTLALAGLLLWFSSPRRPASPEPGYETVRVAAYNTYTRLNDPAVAAWLERESVDLLALIDPPYSLDRTELLPDALKAHTLIRPRGLETRLAVASRFPIEQEPIVEEIHHTNQRSFVAHGTVIVTTPSGARFRFAPMHPVSPRTEHSWAAALSETKREARWIAETGGLPWVVGGDFNATPASRLWREFASVSGLRSPVLPFAQGTWPADAPASIALPIDRVWASPGVRFGPVTVGPEFRSDHRPIVFELYIPIQDGPPAPAPDQSDQ